MATLTKTKCHCHEKRSVTNAPALFVLVVFVLFLLFFSYFYLTWIAYGLIFALLCLTCACLKDFDLALRDRATAPLDFDFALLFGLLKRYRPIWEIVAA